MLACKILPAGDTALVVELGDTIDRRISAQVLALGRLLTERRLDGVVEIVPTFRSLTVHYEPLVIPAARLIAQIEELGRELHVAPAAARRWRVPVCYDARVAPDLDHVSNRCGLSPAQLVERHSTVAYHVYMLGFLPGQAYLGDLPPELGLARRETPRRTIPAGSLGIAMTMTCIFPQQTPCGWHLIGQSAVPLWRTGPLAGALLAPGDEVTFQPISLREYENQLARVTDGSFRLQPIDQAARAAA